MVPLDATMQWLIETGHIDIMEGHDTSRIANYLSFPLRWWIGEENLLDNRQKDDLENLKVALARDFNYIGGVPLDNTGIHSFPPYDTIGMALALEPHLGSSPLYQKVYVDYNCDTIFTCGKTFVDPDLARSPVSVYYGYDQNMATIIVDRWTETKHH